MSRNELGMLQGNYAEIDGQPLYYETRGKGTPVIFLHTAGTDGRVWKQFSELLPESIMAIIPDLPGHGKSWPWPGWRKKRVDVAFYADRIGKLVDKLKLESVVIVGCSIGADISLMLASLLGKKAKAVIPLEGAARTNTFLEQDILKTDPGNVERAFDFCGRNAKKEHIEDLIWIRSSNNRDIYVTDLLAWNNFDYSKELASVDTRVILMRGEEDPVVTEAMLEDTVKIIPNSSKQTLKGLGHYPMLEDPEALYKILLPILSEYTS